MPPAGRKPKTAESHRRARRLANFLRSRRQEHNGLTAEKLAQKARVSVDTVRKLEAGRISDPGFFTVGRLAVVLGAQLSELFEAASSKR